MSRHENIARQCEVAEAAWATLAQALEDLAASARAASKQRTSIEDVYAGVNRVRRAEEAHDLALLDVATARGEDA